MDEGLEARAVDGPDDEFPGPGTAPKRLLQDQTLHSKNFKAFKIVLRYKSLKEVNITIKLTKSGLPWLSNQD